MPRVRKAGQKRIPTPEKPRNIAGDLLSPIGVARELGQVYREFHYGKIGGEELTIRTRALSVLRHVVDGIVSAEIMARLMALEKEAARKDAMPTLTMKPTSVLELPPIES
jgi:hypothetical protein